MRYFVKLIYCLCSLLSIAAVTVAQAENYAQSKKGQAFIAEQAGQYYSQAELEQLFTQITRDEAVLRKISRPAEKTKPWYEYRNIFLDTPRIENGVRFYQQHQSVLQEAYQRYGVDPAIIVAIIGVETRYGKVMGKDGVLTALATIAFDYPKRETFFTAELVAFLQMTRQYQLDPLALQGSYAGAMGMGQFMPSSYLRYAVDYDGDGKKDLWQNPNDAIFSVANYLAEHGWQRNEPIVDRAYVSKPYNGEFNHKPFLQLGDLARQGVFLETVVATNDRRVGIMLLDSGKNEQNLFITFPNFAAITTYNTSKMYALAVVELSRAIAAKL